MRRKLKFADFGAIIGAVGFLALIGAHIYTDQKGDFVFVYGCILLMVGAPVQRILEIIFNKKIGDVFTDEEEEPPNKNYRPPRHRPPRRWEYDDER